METIAEAFPTTAARSTVAAARGAIALAEGCPTDALVHLRGAVNGWRELGVPYEAAMVGVRIAEACRVLGDEDGVRMELRAALATFERLGARPDADRARELLPDRPVACVWAESSRDRGSPADRRRRTNAEIAAELYLSERTVHRHVSNILTKLDVRSRTAAAILAVQRGLT